MEGAVQYISGVLSLLSSIANDLVKAVFAIPALDSESALYQILFVSGDQLHFLSSAAGE